MKIRIDLLEQRYSRFEEFIKKMDKCPFLSFKDSVFINMSENYKYSVYEEARNALGSKWWKQDQIGSGIIKESVTNAIHANVVHSGKRINNNLVNWRQKNDLLNQSKNKNLEEIFFNLYKSKASEVTIFERLINEKISYQFIAYLFFIKDRNRFLPISQEKFDHIFELIGLSEFKTSRNVSWENYKTFIDIIQQVQSFLRTKDSAATLLDAHSFLWILGNQMKGPVIEEGSAKTKSKHVRATESVIYSVEDVQPAQQAIAEEDDVLYFPEGKEVFALHRSKERNKALIRLAKQQRLAEDPKLCCQICGFSFVEKYGELGAGFIEAHHVLPLSQLREEMLTKPEDLAFVCSNCHRMLHRKRPWVTMSDLKIITQQAHTEQLES
ncbi:HNH endonuclease [Hymenobacter sp. BT186]|uniref:HNH endonuclease n=1 Tax=Hymenobacter telluris TaxID=2816474 RepID=A0A939F3F9_9BACT|nr:HNH endonuclease [Hymenobacter telluris]MBO0360683.1 HNH endonuclease [Hymenobacter telluris]MBW3376710.1 HNH endonuclease [Hymenobacter norwichensis]